MAEAWRARKRRAERARASSGLSKEAAGVEAAAVGADDKGGSMFFVFSFAGVRARVSIFSSWNRRGSDAHVEEAMRVGGAARLRERARREE